GTSNTSLLLQHGACFSHGSRRIYPHILPRSVAWALAPLVGNWKEPVRHERSRGDGGVLTVWSSKTFQVYYDFTSRLKCPSPESEESFTYAPTLPLTANC